MSTTIQNQESTGGHFGDHVTLDGYDGNPEKLNDKEIVLSCLNELPEEMEMKKMTEPQICHINKSEWSGYVIIEESHISIHTFPQKRFVSVDVYTCKNGLDVGHITKFFIEKFELKSTEVNLIYRGLKYPKENIE